MRTYNTIGELYAQPDSWCQGAMAVTAAGFKLDEAIDPNLKNYHGPLLQAAIAAEIRSDAYVRFCLKGAIYRVYGWTEVNHESVIFQKLKAEIDKVHPGRFSILTEYNDNPFRAFNDVRGIVAAAGV